MDKMENASRLFIAPRLITTIPFYACEMGPGQSGRADPEPVPPWEWRRGRN